MNEKLHKLLQELIETEEQRQEWLKTPNPELGGRSPGELIAEGKGSIVVGYLEDYYKGSLS